MQTHHYLLALFIIAAVGFALAAWQDMKNITKPTARKWQAWMIITALLMMGDFALIRAFTP